MPTALGCSCGDYTDRGCPFKGSGNPAISRPSTHHLALQSTIKHYKGTKKTLGVAIQKGTATEGKAIQAEPREKATSNVCQDTGTSAGGLRRTGRERPNQLAVFAFFQAPAWLEIP